MRAKNYMPDDTMSDGVVIVSGGMDSITLTEYLMQTRGRRPHMVSFDYGQRHRRELEYAEANAERLGLHWSLIDLSSVTHLISSSALTSMAQPVPEGHYSEDNMAITVVPNRNMMMLSIAAAIAVSNKYTYIAAGMHAGDHAQYPDCRKDFLHACEMTILRGNEGFYAPGLEILAPFIDKSKGDIAQAAYRLGVPLDMTWSCYKGDQIHCGRCATCVERLEAIASVDEAPVGWDKTKYRDTTYWRQVVREYRMAHEGESF